MMSSILLPFLFQKRSSEGNEVVLAKAALALLHEGGLRLKNVQSFLQALNLGCAASLALFIGLWLGNAAILDLGIVVEDCRQLGVGVVAVAGQVSDLLVQALELLGLVLGVLSLHGYSHLVVLSGCLIGRDSIAFGLLLISQVLCEVRFDDLKDVHDRTSCTAGSCVLLGGCWLLHEGVETSCRLHEGR